MLIRREQFTVLEQDLRRRYIESVCRFLREHVPELVSRLEDAALVDRIERAASEARTVGIRTDEGVLAYIGLSIAAGPGFCTEPRVRRFLDSSTNDPDMKIRWLFQRVTSDLQASTG
jgi:hypothetical protein